MKRILILLMTIIVFFTHSFYLASGDKQEDEYPDNLIYYDTSIDDTLTNRTFRYYVFVYSSTHTFYNETAIGPCDCVDGGFYVKDFEKKTIRQLVDLSVKVDYYNGNDNGIYFTSNNGLYKVDYIGKECQLIYQGTDLNSGFITYDGGYVYINDIKDFIVVDEATLEYEVIPNIGRSNSFYVEENNLEYYDLDLEQVNILDLTTKVVTAKEGLYYNNNYIEQDDVSLDVSDSNAKVSTRTTSEYMPTNVDNNFTTIYNQYPPNNSAFTMNGVSRKYNKGIQCFGFALYCYDVFSHRTSINSTDAVWDGPSRPYNDVRYVEDDDNTILTTYEVQLIFSLCNRGSHLRFKNKYDSYNHSLLYMGMTTDNKYIIYDANWWSAGACTIKQYDRNTNFFVSNFTFLCHFYSHCFTSTENYDSSYHKCLCGNSGCNGYYYELHDKIIEVNDELRHHISCATVGCSYSAFSLHRYVDVNGISTCIVCGYEEGSLYDW